MPSATRLLQRISWLGIPIAAYLVITLGFPLANGAAGRADFAHHAGIVLAACLGVIAGALALHALVDTVRRRP
jgi:hypothetical protein